MAVMTIILRLLDKLKFAKFSSLFQPLIFIFFVSLFSRIDSTIAYSNESNNEEYQKALRLNNQSEISDKMLFEQTGNSSWYSNKFQNKKTSNGERYCKDKLTAAHKKLPFGSIVKVTNLKSGKIVFVRINDRGPFSKKRVIDLSRTAASVLGALGNPKVKIETLLPMNSFDSEEEANKYMLTFSYDQKPSCEPADNFNIILEYTDFDTAAEEFAKIQHFNKGSKVYLLTSPDIEPDYHKDEKTTGKYYIGYIKNSLDLSMFKLF